jgi:hypothetical protein
MASPEGIPESGKVGINRYEERKDLFEREDKVCTGKGLFLYSVSEFTR